MPEPRRGLGRGLDSLIPGMGSSSEDAGVASIDIDALEPNPLQPRTDWDDEDLETLAASIDEHGVIQPLIVTHGTGSTAYQIIAGERRWRAARRAGLSSVPVLIREVTTLEALEIALVENVQRADLNPIEEALAFQHLSQEFGLTQGQIATRVGKSRSAIANTIRLLDAPEQVRAAVVNGDISAGHARALLTLDERSRQLEVLDRIVARGLSVRQTERLVKQLMDESNQRRKKPHPSLSPDERAIQDRLQHNLGTRVDVTRGQNGGRIVIHFFSDEEFGDLVERLDATER